MKSKEFYELKYPNDTLSVHTGSSDAILALQKFLNERGYTDAYGRPLAEDGVYGKNTFNAVIKYQSANGLSEDGIVGDKTWNSMYETIKNEEMNNAISSGNINAYYAESELNTKDMNPSMYRVPKKSESKRGTGIGEVIGAINYYRNVSDGSPKKTYTDGYVEAELERIEEQGGVENPAQKQTEEWTKAKGEELARKGNYMGAYTMGFYD